MPAMATRTAWLIVLVVMIYLTRGQQIPVRAALILLIGLSFGQIVQWALRLAGRPTDETNIEIAYKSAAIQSIFLFLLDVYADDSGIFKAIEDQFGLVASSLIAYVCALGILFLERRYSANQSSSYTILSIISLFSAAILFVALYMDDPAFHKYLDWIKEIDGFLKAPK